MYKNKKVSVVMATYQERYSIRRVIEEFFATGMVDELIVVNNNAEPGTKEEIEKTKAKMAYETKQGYGYAFRRGIKEADGDYILLCEPDFTFSGKDLEKFLSYAQDFEVVLGCRTNSSTLGKGSAMTPLRRIGNVAYAKILEILFGTKTITDIGCTYKLFHRTALRKIEQQLKATDSLFATELILLVVKNDISFVEIPITYRARIGHSTIIHEWYVWIVWSYSVLVYILKTWLIHLRTKMIGMVSIHD